MPTYSKNLRKLFSNLGYKNVDEILDLAIPETPEVLSYTEALPFKIAGNSYHMEHLFFLNNSRVQFDKIDVQFAGIVQWEPKIRKFVSLNVEAGTALFQRKKGELMHHDNLMEMFEKRQKLIVEQLHALKVSHSVAASHHLSRSKHL